jgi:hypothetical protein
MSSESTTNSGDRFQATLDVIMCHLDNIELKLEPLQTRVDAPEVAVTNQDQHHQELHDDRDCLEHTGRSPPTATRLAGR